MTTINSTATSTLNDAHDLLYRTESMVSFVQSITLGEGQADLELSLTSDQVTGLYYVLSNIRENLSKVLEQIVAAKMEMRRHDK